MKKLIIIIMILVLIFVIIKFIDGYYSERVSTYIEQKTTVYATKMIEETIKEEVLVSIDLNEMILWGDDNKSITINTNMVNNVLTKVNSSLTKKLNKLEKEKVYLSLPLSTIFSETVFNNFGPEIRIKIFPVGSAITDVVTDIEEYGINNSVFRIDICVSISYAVVLPLNNQKTTIKTRIPLLIQTIQGEIPRYYFYGNAGNPITVLPNDE